jgi:hypothetical protein
MYQGVPWAPAALSLDVGRTLRFDRPSPVDEQGQVQPNLEVVFPQGRINAQPSKVEWAAGRLHTQMKSSTLLLPWYIHTQAIYPPAPPYLGPKDTAGLA